MSTSGAAEDDDRGPDEPVEAQGSDVDQPSELMKAGPPPGVLAPPALPGAIAAGVRRVADQVSATHRLSGRDSWRSVSSLLTSIGEKALTPSVREGLTSALADQGIAIEPALTDPEVGRSQRVRLVPVEAEPGTAVAPEVAAASVTEDLPGPVRRFGDVIFFQVSPDADPDGVFNEIGPYCPGLDEAALADALQIDPVPGVIQFEAMDGTTLAKIVTFGLADAGEVRGMPAGTDDDPEDVVVQPVEMLIGPGWVIACWHNSELLGDPDQSEQAGPAATLVDALLDTIEQRLPSGGVAVDGHKPTSLEVALRVAERLSRRYLGAVRHLEDLVDAWSVQFGHQTSASGHGLGPVAYQELSVLQVRVTGLLRRLRPLEGQLDAETETDRRPGWANGDYEYERTLRWQRTLSRTESRLIAAADEIRVSYQLLVVQHLAEQMRRTEETRRLESAQGRRDQWFASVVAIGAAILLVPALVAGIWGMNVGVPGQGDPQWFWIVLAIMIVATTAIVVAFIVLWRVGVRILEERRSVSTD